MNKKISVALATYNGEKYILQQLDSLKNQTYQIDEIIICDDASTDDTVDIIVNYIHDHQLDHWKLYVNKENLGYKKNFKETLKKTTGDIIFLCDQDDIWELNKVETLVNLFNKHKIIKCINTSFRCINEKNERLNDFSFIQKDLKENELIQIPFEEIVIKNIAMGCTMALTKDIKQLYLSLSNEMAAHDWELNCIASLFDGLYYLNTCLIQYRIHSNNTTGIDTMNKKSKKQLRIKNSIEIDNLLNGLLRYKAYLKDSYYELLNQCIDFSRKRVVLLSQGEKKYWLSLLKQYSMYRKYVSIKGILYDFIA